VWVPPRPGPHVGEEMPAPKGPAARSQVTNRREEDPSRYRYTEVGENKVKKIGVECCNFPKKELDRRKKNRLLLPSRRSSL
jgi:hypothetical protein